MSVLPQQQYSGLKATCQIAFSPPESTPPYLFLYQPLTEYPKVQSLSALLFCIYLNDLPSVSRDSKLESYVDGSKVLLSFPLRQIDAAITNLEQGLHRVASWCCENHLLINPGKTKYMMIGTRQL
jgi:hypothetical protein